MTTLLPFKSNEQMTVGVELELQLINLQSFNLVMEAKDFLRRLKKTTCFGDIKPEITQAMIEINTSIHPTYSSLLNELHLIRNHVADEAAKSHIGVCGGGTHPFQKWREQRIFNSERFSSVSEQYGFLAQQFTVFGQHIHIACANGDDALYLCHAMASYIPHFIALAASSPFNQTVDTSFDCSRLTVVSAFPLSGTPPWIMQWGEFENYFQKEIELGIASSMKDLYWDIRPKPEFGTVEIRVCDTPLTVDRAADIAAFAQLLACYLLDNKQVLSKDIYLTYLTNRFRATRYGLRAQIIDPIRKEQRLLADDLIKTCGFIMQYASRFDAENAITNILNQAVSCENDAAWLRKRYTKFNSLADTVRAQVEYWGASC